MSLEKKKVTVPKEGKIIWGVCSKRSKRIINFFFFLFGKTGVCKKGVLKFRQKTGPRQTARPYVWAVVFDGLLSPRTSSHSRSRRDSCTVTVKKGPVYKGSFLRHASEYKTVFTETEECQLEELTEPGVLSCKRKRSEEKRLMGYEREGEGRDIDSPTFLSQDPGKRRTEPVLERIRLSTTEGLCLEVGSGSRTE